MTKLKSFDQFAKGKLVEPKKNNRCVIYTRVSTKEQAENNMSLDTQRKACEQYIRKLNYTIMAYFGGTYESAKTDERKEFNNMLDYVRKSRMKISYIIVYTVDRFSRSGANAIYISEQLKNEGISLISVSQPTDVSTPSGKLQQNIQFIFSEYDNQLRREKTVAGMRNKLLMGEWCMKPPRGYDTIKVNGKRSIVLNADGELIRKAFMWRYYERLPQSGIRERLKSLGLSVSRSNISELLRNPFYCGILVHNMLAGKIVKGKHEKIISKEVFLAINNNSLAGIAQEYNFLNPEIPLKRTLICEKCEAKMSGYLVREKKLYYYKCSTIGCKTNKSASKLHELFVEELNKIDYNSKSFIMLKKELIESLVGVNKVNYYTCNTYSSTLGRLKIKMENIEERFALGKISDDLYQKYLKEYQTQKAKIENELDKTKAVLIQRKDKNAEIEKRVEDIPTMWREGSLQVKRLIQFTVFPEGIYYNRQIDKLSLNRLKEPEPNCIVKDEQLS